MSLKKITDLTETRWRTVHSVDEYGNRVREQVSYVAKREVRTVSAGPRIGHFIVDLILFEIVIMFFTFILGLANILSEDSPVTNLSINFIGNVLLILLYPYLYAMCEHLWQRTPGKFLTKTLVIDEYGNRPELKTILLRSVIRLVPFEVFSCFGDYSRGWHDEWSKTWVVPDDELKELKRLQREQSAEAQP